MVLYHRGALPPGVHQEGEQGWRRAGGPRLPCRAPAIAARAATDAREGGGGGGGGRERVGGGERFMSLFGHCIFIYPRLWMRM